MWAPPPARRRLAHQWTCQQPREATPRGATDFPGDLRPVTGRRGVRTHLAAQDGRGPVPRPAGRARQAGPIPGGCHGRPAAPDGRDGSGGRRIRPVTGRPGRRHRCATGLSLAPVSPVPGAITAGSG
jgi:hypothetical protein